MKIYCYYIIMNYLRLLPNDMLLLISKHSRYNIVSKYMSRSYAELSYFMNYLLFQSSSEGYQINYFNFTIKNIYMRCYNKMSEMEFMFEFNISDDITQLINIAIYDKYNQHGYYHFTAKSGLKFKQSIYIGNEYSVGFPGNGGWEYSSCNIQKIYDRGCYEK